jgi:hypothetical protein
MRRIGINDVEPLCSADVVDLRAVSDLEGIARYILAASKTPGDLGRSACKAVDQALVALHEDALLRVLKQLPPDVRSLLEGSNFPESVRMMTDEGGTYCIIARELEAVIGSAEEIAQILFRAALRAARSTAANEEAPPDARYRAALLMKSRLRSVT